MGLGKDLMADFQYEIDGEPFSGKKKPKSVKRINKAFDKEIKKRVKALKRDMG